MTNCCPGSVQEDHPDYMEDAVGISRGMDRLENEEEEVGLCWQEGEVTIDKRVANPAEAFQGRAQLHISAKEYTSPAMYFLRFIPEIHIQEVVIPAFNELAVSVMANFEPVTYSEYLVWISLFILMMTVRVDNYKTYWHEGPLASLLRIDFRQYMTRQRFDLIMQMHIFAGLMQLGNFFLM